jgi:hypothetical protein
MQDVKGGEKRKLEASVLQDVHTNMKPTRTSGRKAARKIFGDAYVV